MLIAGNDVAADVYGTYLSVTGFLPARAFGLAADSDDYALAIDAVVSTVKDHLKAYGVNPETDVDPMNRLLALRMARFYAAERVLTHLRTGQSQDPTGAMRRFSESDLRHWLAMMDRNEKYMSEQLAALVPNGSAVMFAPLHQALDTLKSFEYIVSHRNLGPNDAAY